MDHPKFDREKLSFMKLAERRNQLSIESVLVRPGYKPENLSAADKHLIGTTASRIINARKNGKPVILTFGAHTIKNGLGPVLIGLIEKGWVTHLATNGAGIIHDWEFAFQGMSGENVRENVSNGSFGMWHETGFYINLAIVTGAWEGLGYGESVGKMIFREGIDIPAWQDLLTDASRLAESDPDRASAAIDLSGVVRRYAIGPGFMSIPHPFKQHSVQSKAYELGIPFTAHPMFGHDIIYLHPVNHGGATGRTAMTDFLRFASGVSRIDGGVYLSLGSSVMSPMIFEKSLSMAQNIAIQENRHIDNHFIVVVDLAKADWDWKNYGEPSPDNPSYYLRYCKTFNRMGGEMHYMCADNRDFLTSLYSLLPEDSL